MIKNICVYAGNYNPKQLEEHYEKYKNCLSQIRGNRVNIKQNIERLAQPEQSADDIISVINNTTTNELEVGKILVQKALETSKNLLIDFPKNEENLETFEFFGRHQEAFCTICKTSKQNLIENSVGCVNNLGDQLGTLLSVENINILYKLLELSNINQTLTYLTLEHKIILIIGFKTYIIYMYSVIGSNSTTELLKTVIYKLNMRILLKGSENIYKHIYIVCKPYIYVPTAVFLGSNFVFHTWLKKNLTFLDVVTKKVDNAAEKIVGTGITHTVIETIAYLPDMIAYTIGRVFGGAYSAFYTGVLKKILEKTKDD